MIASKTPCDKVDKNRTIVNMSFLFLPKRKDSNTDHKTANRMEFVNPLCPKRCE
jgi:hypothetical protein